MEMLEVSSDKSGCNGFSHITVNGQMVFSLLVASKVLKMTTFDGKVNKT
jgi:hypothetical protein